MVLSSELLHYLGKNVFATVKKRVSLTVNASGVSPNLNVTAVGILPGNVTSMVTIYFSCHFTSASVDANSEKLFNSLNIPTNR